MSNYTMTKAREKEVKAFLNTPIKEGESVLVKGNKVNSTHGKNFNCTIIKVLGDDRFEVNVTSRDYDSKYTIDGSDIVLRDTGHIGADPFEKRNSKLRLVQFSLESIISVLDLLDQRANDGQSEFIAKECNWDPFVYSSTGEKQRYQRPFVWTPPQKRALISSIYKQVDCGKIIIRVRTYEELRGLHANGETELAYHDIVDGKQRLNAVKEFMLGKFKDVHGNFYGDLSRLAQRKFIDHQLFSYGYLDNYPTDLEVLEQFLKMNFSGIPQSPKHMKFVEGLYRNI